MFYAKDISKEWFYPLNSFFHIIWYFLNSSINLYVYKILLTLQPKFFTVLGFQKMWKNFKFFFNIYIILSNKYYNIRYEKKKLDFILEKNLRNFACAKKRLGFQTED